MVDLNRIGCETFARFVEHHESLPSTNDLAMRMATDPRTESPLLLIAAEQTAGRGRGGNRWWSSPGSLTFSLLFDTADFALPQPRWPSVAIAAGLALCDVIPQFVPAARTGLKWPNDVWLNGRKACGILVEVPPCRPPAPPRLVVGVGLNVNNSSSSAPPGIRERAIALCDIADQPIDPTDVLVAFLRQVETNLKDLGGPSGPGANLVQRWQSQCVLTNRTVSIDAGRPVSGRCLGIEPDGSLLIETADGPARVYGGIVESIA